MVVVNIAGSTLVARAQSVIVFIVIGILTLFAVVTITNMDPALLAPSGYPPSGTSSPVWLSHSSRSWASGS